MKTNIYYLLIAFSIKSNYIMIKLDSHTKEKMMINFNNDLFTEAMRQNIIDNVESSNILKAHLLENINKIYFFLKKDNNFLFTLSLKTRWNNNDIHKDIHLEQNGDDFYVLVKQILERLEQQIRKYK